jgi:ABC-type multidrug transport system ATPase subunit
MAGIIECDNVSFSADDNLIVRNFSYSFEEGKTTAIIGPSGSGKSTVLKLAAGILVPNEGEVSFRGNDIFEMSRQENLDFRREASMVFQDAALWANQNLDQILDLPLQIHFPEMPTQERKKRVNEVLGEVGYRRALNIRPSQLSMGEQKLIAFARALLCRPKLLFLDEWTESLDDAAVNRAVQIVRRHRQEGNSVILVSHDFRIVKGLADYIIMIVRGAFSNVFTHEQIENDEDLANRIEDGITS